MTVPVNGHPPPLELGVLLDVMFSPAVEVIEPWPDPCACRLHQTIAERGAASLWIGIR